MNKKYNNSPITEAVCEFIFDISNTVDNVFVDKFYDKIKEIFPDRKKGLDNKVEFKIDQKSGNDFFNKTTQKFDQFFSKDRKTFLQLKKDGRISIHKIKPYDSWTIFSKQISIVFQSYLKLAEIKSVKRIGLRYINNFQIQELSFKLEEYFNFRPATFGAVPSDLAGFSIGSIFAFEDKKDLAKVQILNLPSNTEKAVFMLDIDYYSGMPNTIRVDDSCAWVEKAHSHIEELFESILTDKIKNSFN